MRAVIQRVSRASVAVEGKVISNIHSGMLILLGIEEADEESDAQWLCGKISSMRIFQDENDKMNLSLKDIDGEALIVSQFTLHASTRKGNRPSFIRAARPEKANELYTRFIGYLETELGKKVGRGEFGAMMQVELINDGPVTILIDSKNKE